jgi:cation/acetate symporter
MGVLEIFLDIYCDFPPFVVLLAVSIIAYVASVTDRSASADKERAAFEAQMIRSETGLGAEVASGH